MLVFVQKTWHYLGSRDKIRSKLKVIISIIYQQIAYIQIYILYFHILFQFQSLEVKQIKLIVNIKSYNFHAMLKKF